jgi:hypothetical protein
MSEPVMTRDHRTHTRSYSLGMLTRIGIALVIVAILVFRWGEAALSRWNGHRALVAHRARRRRRRRDRLGVVALQVLSVRDVWRLMGIDRALG